MGKMSEKTVRRHRPDYLILLMMGLLMLFGLIVMYEIGPDRAHVLNNGSDYYSPTYFFAKQAISLVLALAVFFVVAKIPTMFLKDRARLLYWIGIGACVALFLIGNVFHIQQLVPNINGAYRWFSLGPLGSLQPSEFLKFALVVYVAQFLSVRKAQGLIDDIHRTLIPLCGIVGLVVIFVIGFQKDMGTGLVLLALVAAMLVVSGMSRKMALKMFGIALAAGLLLIVTQPHRLARVTTFFGTSSGSSAQAADYHITQAKIAIGSGGFFGVGIGNSIQATGYLPESINDSVFAIIGETFGFVGLMVILAVFTTLLVRLLSIAEHLIDDWKQLVVIGVFGWLCAHVVLNIAAMTGVFPLTGITLPMLSFGGTSMVFIAAGLGLAFQLSQHTVHTLRKEETYEDTRSRRGIGRSRYANRRGY